MNFQKQIKPVLSNLILFILLITIIAFQCKTAQLSESTIDTATQNIAEIYSEYNSLKASFMLVGNISNKPFSYPGKLQFSKNIVQNKMDLTLTITDPVFLSPLTTIILDGQNLIYRDYINNRSEKLVYDNSSIYFFSNYPIPAEVIIPAITGMLPDSFLSKGRKSKDGKSYHLTKKDYELVGFFKDNIMHMLILNPPESINQIVFTFEGQLKNSKNRFFPNKVNLELSNKDHLQLNFNRVLIE